MHRSKITKKEALFEQRPKVSVHRLGVQGPHSFDIAAANKSAVCPDGLMVLAFERAEISEFTQPAVD